MVVTVACICYNQAAFIEESIRSVLDQSYHSVEIWVLDDASTDDSAAIITRLKESNPMINIYLSEENIGHTRLFNRMLPNFKGNAIIDLSGDDLLLPDRISEGVTSFTDNPACGVHFCNAEIIDEEGDHLSWHYQVDDNLTSLDKVPEGDVFAPLIGTYFINPVTMMIRREVFDVLKGYDASLSYEDFDFWIRSSRIFNYLYTDKVLVKRRIHPENYSKKQYRFGSQQMKDTLKICKKIPPMLRTAAERSAYHRRIGFEMRQCLRVGNLRLFLQYLSLL